MGATLQPSTVAERISRAVVVPETHFQFNAIVQNQLPRSSRNIRAKFTAESVLLAWPRRHRPKLSCPARTQTSFLGTLTYEIIAAPVTDSVDRRETAVETAKASGNRGDYAISRRAVSLSLMPGTLANSLYCGTDTRHQAKKHRTGKTILIVRSKRGA